MEEALRPDDVHMVRAYPPTLWHLTIVFCEKSKGIRKYKRTDTKQSWRHKV